MATPVVLYKFNEGSGTSVSDTSAGTAVNLALTNGTGSAWTSIASGNGWATGTHTGNDTTIACKSAALNGTKIETALNGATSMTYEFVINVPAGGATGGGGVVDLVGTVGGLIGIYKKANAHTWELWFPDNTSTEGYTVPMPTAGTTTTVHMTVDTTSAVAANRVPLVRYNDVSQTVTTVAGTAQNTAQTINSAYKLLVANLDESVGWTTTATWYYLAIYSSVLSAADITAHTAALAANNNAVPNRGHTGGPWRAPAALA